MNVRSRILHGPVAALVAVSTLVGLVGFAPPTQAIVPPAVFSSPPATGVHNHPLWDSYYELAPFGYEEQEYFVSGTAVADDATSAPYTTRVVVSRPTPQAGDGPDFNGTVMLDWTNVTAQFENAVSTMEAREMLMREGFAFVHVSAQAAGVCCSPLTPKVWDPVRYAELDHPGDKYSNHMLTQIAQAFRAGAGTNDQPVTHVMAAGQSQSGSKLYDYATKYLVSHPDAQGIIDGVVVHGSASSQKANLAQAPEAVKVLHLLSDNEAVADGYVPSDTDANYRLWEIAGTAHSDYFIGYQSVVGLGPRTLLDAPQVDRAGYQRIIDGAGNYGAELHPMLATCVLAGAAMPMHYATSTAILRLDQWMKGGSAPANGPRFEFDPLTDKLATDRHGNTRGGIRMPPIDVPVASYRSTLCPLGGITVPFNDAGLRLLYPGGFEEYQSRMQQATSQAVAGGWLLAPDALDLMARVDAARGRFLLAGT